LFDQLYGLKDLYSTAIMLLEGYLPIIYKFTHVTPSAVWGAMYALAKHGISVVNTANYNETADFLYTAARQEQIVERRTLRIHAEKKIDTLSDAQLYFVASLPNIGRERARAILKFYRKPLLAFINVDDWAKQIRGLGPKISSKARAILNTEFED
jgi:ERCC4-type nuclease